MLERGELGERWSGVVRRVLAGQVWETEELVVLEEAQGAGLLLSSLWLDSESQSSQ